MNGVSLKESIKTKPITIITQLLIIIGALNWLAIGATSTNYVSKFSGAYSQYVFIAVGIAGIYQLYILLNSYTETQLPVSLNNFLKVIDEKNRLRFTNNLLKINLLYIKNTMIVVLITKFI